MSLSAQILLESVLVKYLFYKKYLKKRSLTNSMIYKDRLVFSKFYHLYPQFRKNEALFCSYTRMTTTTFDYTYI